MATADVYIQAPPMLTADEVALVLRLGRSKTYEFARRFMATDGEEGIPCVRIGHHLRFPRHQIEELIGGTIPWPLVAEPGVEPDEVDARDETTNGADRSTKVGRPASQSPSSPHDSPRLFSV